MPTNSETHVKRPFSTNNIRPLPQRESGRYEVLLGPSFAIGIRIFIRNLLQGILLR